MQHLRIPAFFAVLLVGGCTSATPQATQQDLLVKDVKDFGRFIAVNPKYKVVKLVKVGGRTTDTFKSEPLLLKSNPFVMVRKDWQKLSMPQKRAVVTEVYDIWVRYCKRSGRYPVIFFQLHPGGKTVGYCGKDDGCSSEGYADE